MRITPIMIALIIVVVIAAAVTALILSMWSASFMNYVYDYRDLVNNGSFTASYNSSYVEFIEAGENDQGPFQCFESSQYSVGPINGSRAVVTTEEILCPSYSAFRIVMQRMAYWINGTSICSAVHAIINNHSVGSINCLSPGTYPLLRVYMPFTMLLGNATFKFTTNEYSINYSVTTHIHYVNTTKWHDQTVHCFQVIGKYYYGTSQGVGMVYESNVTEFLCLLPNGLPATTVFNDIIMVKPLQSNTTTRISMQGRSTLISYTLNYFNATAFRELISTTGS